MLSELNVDAYLWSDAASQVDFYCILSRTPNFYDGLLIRLPSSLTASPPKLYWFIQIAEYPRPPLSSSQTLFLRLVADPCSMRILFAGHALIFSPILLRQ
ncbi:unnamed protein product [Protopolystoma xenopodis]|uniref:Uncharacterized protein n=1 Tax=Protopolystoma xenopodis TaxID=117903 RepID=A0A3S4ZW74_9PLAT|nr:unnamed protein product [Protopolystoma xenopodis]